MKSSHPSDALQVKKYPNRRYYDATNSRHVSLGDLYKVVCEGRDISVTDSKTGADITNLVLLQIMLEKEQPKLDIFPSAILHTMIRTNRQALRASADRFFGPLLDMFAATQKHLDSYWRQTLGSGAITPLEWANHMANAFVPQTNAPTADTTEENVDFDGEEPDPGHESIDDIRRQLAELTNKIETMQDKQPDSSS